MAQHTKFVWYELMTTNPDAAQDFYTKLIGWGTGPFEGHENGMPYTMWTAGEKPIGGLMELPEQARKGGAPPHWMGYVGVEDVAATAAEAAQLGACALVPATDIPGAGTFAVLADPQGAVFALYSTKAESSEETCIDEGPGHFSWRELATSDYRAGFEFYAKLFGWTVQDDMDMGDAGVYRIYGPQNGPPLGGMFTKPAEMPGPPAWLYYVTVADLDAAIAKIGKLGGQVLNGPMEVPGGDKIAQCLDPQGAAFALHWSKNG